MSDKNPLATRPARARYTASRVVGAAPACVLVAASVVALLDDLLIDGLSLEKRGRRAELGRSGPPSFSGLLPRLIANAAMAA
jgi:hypothetical protein